MPTLSYRCTEDNGLSFELLVDGEPLGALVGARDTAFPYWIVEDGLPRYPPHGTPDDPDARIVCVCNCGEYGCGHTGCRMTREGDEVNVAQGGRGGCGNLHFKTSTNRAPR